MSSASRGHKAQKHDHRNIQNDVNTCWRSSVLQMLAHSQAIRETTNDEDTKTLFEEIVQPGREKVRSKGWFERLKETYPEVPDFPKGAQQDAGEFLLPLLDICFAKPAFLTVTDIIRCKWCMVEIEGNAVSVPLVTLTLDEGLRGEVKKNSADISITDYMKKYFEFEPVDLKKSCTTSECGGRVWEKRTYPTQFPGQLFIQLGRFSTKTVEINVDGEITTKFESKKIKDKILVPLTLSTQDIGVKSGSDYLLRSVVVHSGNSISSGHYYTYVREPEGKWWIYDDLSPEVHGAVVKYGEVKKKMETNGYLFHYEKKVDGAQAERDRMSSSPKWSRSSSPSPAKRSRSSGHSPGLWTWSSSPSPAKRAKTISPKLAVVFIETKEDNANRARVRACVESRFGRVRMQIMDEGLPISVFIPESKGLPPEEKIARRTLFTVEDAPGILRSTSEDLSPDSRLTVLEGILGLALVANKAKNLRASLVPVKHGSYSEPPHNRMYYIGVWDTTVPTKGMKKYKEQMNKYIARIRGWECSACTYFNDAADCQCEICATESFTEAYARNRGESECRRCGRRRKV